MRSFATGSLCKENLMWKEVSSWNGAAYSKAIFCHLQTDFPCPTHARLLPSSLQALEGAFCSTVESVVF